MFVSMWLSWGASLTYGTWKFLTKEQFHVRTTIITNFLHNFHHILTEDHRSDTKLKDNDKDTEHVYNMMKLVSIDKKKVANSFQPVFTLKSRSFSAKETPQCRVLAAGRSVSFTVVSPNCAQEHHENYDFYVIVGNNKSHLTQTAFQLYQWVSSDPHTHIVLLYSLLNFMPNLSRQYINHTDTSS